jgi:hypothetical protein
MLLLYLRAEGEEVLMFTWSMKKDRELIQLARSNLSLDQIAAKMKTTHATARKVAKRLGVHLPPSAAKRNGRLKAKRQ